MNAPLTDLDRQLARFNHPAMHRIAATVRRLALAELAWIDRMLARLGAMVDAAIAAAECRFGGQS